MGFSGGLLSPSVRLALTCLTDFTKWNAPIKFPKSVNATAGILMRSAVSASSFTLMVDCKTVNCESVCKCAKGALSVVLADVSETITGSCLS